MDQIECPPDQPTLGRADLVDRTRALLQAHVPLSLLLDLADPAGPDSVSHFTAEPGDLSWLRPVAG
ncbi:MAG: hypothetical protein JWN88_183 [Frankiales bacterium]|jgi:hypothetical protein|nr:hypothetical protein [Frankiales bacterium]